MEKKRGATLAFFLILAHSLSCLICSCAFVRCIPLVDLSFDSVPIELRCFGQELAARGKRYTSTSLKTTRSMRLSICSSLFLLRCGKETKKKTSTPFDDNKERGDKSPRGFLADFFFGVARAAFRRIPAKTQAQSMESDLLSQLAAGNGSVML